MTPRGGPGSNQHATKPRRARGPLLALVQPSADVGADIDPIGTYDPSGYTGSRRHAQADVARASAALRERAGSSHDVAAQAMNHLTAASERLWADMHRLDRSGARTRDVYQIPPSVLPDDRSPADPPGRLDTAARYADQAVLDLSGPAADKPDDAADQMMLAYGRISHARQALRPLVHHDIGDRR